MEKMCRRFPIGEIMFCTDSILRDFPTRTQPSRISLIAIPSSALVIFLGVTFASIWGLIGAYVMAPEWAAATFGEISGSHPFFFLATWSPAIAAFIVVFFYSGSSGLRAFVARVLIWRGSAGWAYQRRLNLPQKCRSKIPHLHGPGDQPARMVAATFVTLPFHISRHLARPISPRLKELPVDDRHKPQVLGLKAQGALRRFPLPRLPEQLNRGIG